MKGKPSKLAVAKLRGMTAADLQAIDTIQIVCSAAERPVAVLIPLHHFNALTKALNVLKALTKDTITIGPDINPVRQV